MKKPAVILSVALIAGNCGGNFGEEAAPCPPAPDGMTSIGPAGGIVAAGEAQIVFPPMQSPRARPSP